MSNSYSCASCGVAGFAACTDLKGVPLPNGLACNDGSKENQAKSGEGMCTANSDPGWNGEPCGHPTGCQGKMECSTDGICECTKDSKWMQCSKDQKSVCQDSSNLPPGPGPPSPSGGNCEGWPTDPTWSSKTPKTGTPLCKLFNTTPCDPTITCADNTMALTILNGEKLATPTCVPSSVFPANMESNWAAYSTADQMDPNKFNYCHKA